MMNGAGRHLVLSGEEAAVIRQALVTCAQVIARAGGQGPQASTLLAELTRRLPGGRSPDGLLHDIGLAIDYLDFAPAGPEHAVTARRAGPGCLARRPVTGP